ncbi:uncharacterized protein LOC116432681 [Nomia melanderi]|uniref:uncharacterized protein LOC116432681 n=1 Tax=Nomia melanderi TaxID=2448451 RepID=UPI0013040BFB|nr:4-nitrophenylphosphatase-like [Nomia melanderi]
MLVARIIGKYYLTHAREFFLWFGSHTVFQSRCARRASSMSCAHVNGIHASTRSYSSDSEMSGPRNLSEVTREELQRFLDSFDVVFSDCDGVLWILEKSIEGSIECLKKLQDLGKKVHLVSNNSTLSFDQYQKKVEKGGMDLKPEQLIITSKVISWYLKKINFTDEAFVIASRAFRDTFASAGIKMTPKEVPLIVENNVTVSVNNTFNVSSSKAVIVDFWLNIDYSKMAYAINCLKAGDTLFLAGPMDEWIICGEDMHILGPGPIIDLLSTQSGKKPIVCGKPSAALKDYILEICDVKDKKRCLFIGDTLQTDMRFAKDCGFQTLFVASGLDKIEDALQKPETQPDYYVSSLGALLNTLN